MIQAISQTNFDAFIETKANKIGSQSEDKTRHLVKFTNDLDGSVFYAYPSLENIYERYTKMAFFYNATVVLSKATAPTTEKDVLPVDNDHGVVEGLVAIGKLYLAEKDGSEEVQYVQNAKRVQTLTIGYGGTGYTTAPTVTIAAPGTTGGHQATATCTVALGAVNTVTITYAGSGYNTIPIVTLTGGGFTDEATVTATIEQTNYIYYGQ